MKRIITIAIVLVSVALIAFRLVSNKRQIDAKNQVRDNSDLVVSVNVAPVENRMSGKSLNFLGTVKAKQELDIKSEVQGKITQLNVVLGEYVTKGKVIARVDDKVRQLNLAKAEQALADSKQNLERYTNLLEGGAATQAQYDQHKLAYENAQNTVAQARKELSNTVIVAPFNGYIIEKSVEPGAFVNMGAPIVSIIDVSALKVRVNVPEKDVYALKVGDKVGITASVFPGVNYEGTITFISFKGDESHNYPIELSISNNDKHPLKAGTYVNVSFNQKNESFSLQIPREALVGSIKNAKVYTLNENNTATLKSIIAGRDNGRYIEVADGLKEGDKVVTSGQINLKDGMQVRVIENQ